MYRSIVFTLVMSLAFIANLMATSYPEGEVPSIERVKVMQAIVGDEDKPHAGGRLIDGNYQSFWTPNNVLVDTKGIKHLVRLVLVLGGEQKVDYGVVDYNAKTEEMTPVYGRAKLYNKGRLVDNVEIKFYKKSIICDTPNTCVGSAPIPGPDAEFIFGPHKKGDLIVLSFRSAHKYKDYRSVKGVFKPEIKELTLYRDPSQG